MRLLVTGASGFIGARLCQSLAKAWQVTGTYLTQRQGVPPGVAAHPLDVRDAAAVASVFAHARPDAVVHAAALANLRECDERPADALACNRDGTRHVARCARDASVPMIYLSTDLVFDGERGCYADDERPRPACRYGLSKRAGEEAAQEEHPDACILRVALTYGWSVNRRPGATERLLAALRQGAGARLFSDEYRTPIFLDDLCRTIGVVLAAGEKGVCHVAGPSRVSRLELGLAIAEAFVLSTSGIVPVSRTTALPARPRDCSLVGSARLLALGCHHRAPAAGLAHMAANAPG